MLKQRLIGLGYLSVLIALMVGIPVALWIFGGGSPLPDTIPTRSDVGGWFSTKDDGSLFLSALTCVGWLAWATVAFSILLEILAVIRNVRAPKISGLKFQQNMATTLVAGSLLLFGGGTALADTAVEPGNQPTTTLTVEPHASTTSSTGATQSPLPTVITNSGDSAWSLAQTYLGNADRYTEIVDLNEHLLLNNNFLPDGTQITLPADAHNPAPTNSPARTLTVLTTLGDSAWSLAEQHLGDALRYPEILDLNRDILLPGNFLPVGAQVQIPATPQQQPGAPTQSVPAPTAQPAPPAPAAPSPGPAPTEVGTSAPAPAPAPSTPTESAKPAPTAAPAPAPIPAPAGTPTSAPAPGTVEPAPTSETATAPTEASTSPNAPTAASTTAAAPTSPEAVAPGPAAGSSTSLPAPAPETTSAPEATPAESEPPADEADPSTSAPASPTGQPAPITPAPEMPTTGPAEPAAQEGPLVPGGDEQAEQLAMKARDQANAILFPHRAAAEVPAPQAPAPTAEPPAPTTQPAPAPAEASPQPTPAAESPTPTEAPAHAPAAETPAPPITEPPAPATDTPAPTAPPTPAGNQPAPQGVNLYTPPPPIPAAHTDTAPVAADESQTSSYAPAFIGLSALGAFAIAASLVVMRRRQQNARRRGERIPMPTGPTAHTETAVHTVADTRTTQDLDRALRALADHCRTTRQELPALLGVNLSGTISLALEGYVDLPEPWELSADGGWSVDPTRLANPPASAISPYPALVPVGTTDVPPEPATDDIDDLDPDDGELPRASTLLLNLEHFGHLAVSSPNPGVALQAVHSMAWELALSPLADNMHLTLVGLGSELPNLIDSGRVDYADTADDILDRLSRTAGVAADILATQGINSIAAARTTYDTSEMTAPHIVLLAKPLTASQQEQFAAITANHPRLAFAAITATEDPAADWTLRILNDTTAELFHSHSNLSVPLTPQLITPEGHQDLIDLHAIALADPIPAADQTVSWAADDIDEQLHQAPATLLAAPRPVVAVSDIPTDHTEDLTLSELADLPDLDAHLWIHMLGTPTLTPLSGASAPEQRGPLLTELAVLLAMHDGISHTDVDTKMWPKSTIDKIRDDSERAKKKATRRNSAFSRLRAWLGETTTNELAFPKVGDRTGRAKYRLHPEVTSDWDRWQHLITSHPAATSNERLTEALKLVSGQPLSGTSPARYGWATSLQQDIISTVTDAAEELAARHIHLGDLPAAAQVAHKALQVDSAHEGCWRLAIIAAHAQGETDLAQKHIDTLLSEISELEVEPNDETITLLNELAQERTVDGDHRYAIAS